MEPDPKQSQTNIFSTTQALVADYFELMKPRLVGLSLFSAFVGFYLASKGPMNLSLLFATLIGTAMVASSSMVLNQWMERNTDALMMRTAKRPVPSARVEPVEALVFGLVLGVLGLGILEIIVGTMTSLIAAFTLFSYLFVYTPLKKKTTHATLVGALPGALPPLIGWSAVGNVFSIQPWTIFAIIFVWQMPHFYAISWIYRDDYKRAGMPVISLKDSDGRALVKHSLAYILALLPISLLPTLFGVTGYLYFFGAFFLGLVLVIISVYSFRALDRSARYLFRASVIHLSLLFLLIILDKV